jgi:hypothetical protein
VTQIDVSFVGRVGRMEHSTGRSKAPIWVWRLGGEGSAPMALGDRLANLTELSGDDLASLLHRLEALVAKNRFKTLAGGIS